MRRYDSVQVLEDTVTGEITIVFTQEENKQKNFSITLPGDAARKMAEYILSDA